MPHRQRHRGAHPEDAQLFAPSQLERLRTAAEEVVWLLGRDYAMATAVTVVGDHHQLALRQRLALSRALCSQAQAAERAEREIELSAVRGRPLYIDGFNLIITIEVALSGGLILDCLDGTARDLAGMRGSYHPVAETDQALELIGAELGALGAASARFFLDAPVSNSGRLRARITEVARGWPLAVDAELVPNPDAILVRGDNVVTADGAILDRCRGWVNLARAIVDRRCHTAWRPGSFALRSTLPR
jgi:hypothetical protein